MLNKLLVTALVSLVIVMNAWLPNTLAALKPSLSESEVSTREVLYLPSGHGLKLISFGYRNVLADSLWFNTINYFGRHYESDAKYDWLYHMCDLVTTLDPDALHVYEFGANMLSWEGHSYDQSIQLLSKAIEFHPNNWRFYYLRGFIKLFFKRDKLAAKDDFTIASTLPDVHPLVARIAAKQMAELDDPDTAISFLESMLESAQDAHARMVLEERLKEALMKKDLLVLNKAVEVFLGRFGKRPSHLKDLVEARIVKTVPRDPFGGHYRISKDGSVVGSRKITLK